MKETTEFDDIRPYRDEEVPAVMQRLMSDPEFLQVLKGIVPADRREDFLQLVGSFKTIHDFQYEIIKGAIFKMIEKTAARINAGGFEQLATDKAYTYISNHRDIVLDAALICILLAENGYETAQIAIGDNLLARPWIEDVVKLNKSFIVKRGVSVRQMLEVSMHLSRYIHYAEKELKQSVWIAQREGRAKDSNDRTQDSVLKMLAMGGGEGDFLSNIESLHIVPTTLSYEYDPCDYLKAQEFQLRRDDPEYKKTKADDVKNMQTGIAGYKGRIVIQFGQPLNDQLLTIDRALPKNEIVSQVAALIDREIFSNYRFYPINYIAYDRLWGKERFRDQYTDEDLERANDYVAAQVAKIEIPHKDIPFLTGKIWEMYANPVKNHLSVKD